MTASEMIVSSVETGPFRIAYHDSGGSGVPVVFLHAASGKSQMWIHQIPAFTAAGFRCIAIDWRQDNPGSSTGSNSTLLIDAVLTHLGLRQVHLLGSAAGGGTAFKFALSHPDKVSSLIVANSTGLITDRDYLEMGERLRPSPQFDALPIEFRELGPSYRAANPEGVARWKSLAREFEPAAPTLADLSDTPNKAPFVPGSKPNTNANAIVTWAGLAALNMPVLLLSGDADLYTPPSVLRMFATHMPHAELIVIPEAGHSAFWEQPELFNQAVLAFLRKHVS